MNIGHMNSLPLVDVRDNREKTKSLLQELYELCGPMGQKTFYKFILRYFLLVSRYTQYI